MADKEPKLPSETKYRGMVGNWMRFSGAETEKDLPPLLLDVVNADKGDIPSVFRTHFERCAQEDGAAISIAPLFTKEIWDMVRTCNFAPGPLETNDLTKGLHPFTLGAIPGTDHGRAVVARMMDYESMLGQLSAPSKTELEEMATKDVPTPDDLYEGELMAKLTSVALDVL